MRVQGRYEPRHGDTIAERAAVAKKHASPWSLKADKGRGARGLTEVYACRGKLRARVARASVACTQRRS